VTLLYFLSFPTRRSSDLQLQFVFSLESLSFFSRCLLLHYFSRSRICCNNPSTPISSAYSSSIGSAISLNFFRFISFISASSSIVIFFFFLSCFFFFSLSSFSFFFY